MKQRNLKIIPMVLSFVLLFAMLATKPFQVHAQDPLDLNAESAILVDGETGKILYAKNADVMLPPASMTKMMTEYLVLEAIEEGTISWDDTTQISDYAYEISANVLFSGVGLTQSKDYIVSDLYDAMAVFSDNATTIALAEMIAGSETEFVKMMNEKGEELGLADFKFVNSTGLDNDTLGEHVPDGTDPNGSNLLTARSSAQLAYHLVNDFPEALERSSQTTVEFEGYEVENLNWMLQHEATFLQQFHFEGMDGLKTGNTTLAGFTFTGTAERDGKRLISVVMKTNSKEERFQETAKLLNYGYNQFENQEIFTKGYEAENAAIPVTKGKADTVQAEINEAIAIPIKANEEALYSLEYVIDAEKLNEAGELVAPIEKGEVLGKAQHVYEGEEYGTVFGADSISVEVVAADSVEKSNWFMLTLGAIGDFLGNMFTTSVDWIKGLF